MKLFMPAAPRRYSIDCLRLHTGEVAVRHFSLSICVVDGARCAVAMFPESHARPKC